MHSFHPYVADLLVEQHSADRRDSAERHRLARTARMARRPLRGAHRGFRWRRSAASDRRRAVPLVGARAPAQS